MFGTVGGALLKQPRHDAIRTGNHRCAIVSVAIGYM